MHRPLTMLYFALLWVVLAITNTIGYSSQCPEGWKYFAADKTCLKGFDLGKTFDEAREVCQSYGGDLAQVESAAKEKVVNSMMVYFISWIGLEDKHKDGHFTFVDGSELTDYTSWGLREPNNLGGNQYCVVMYSPRPWFTVDCDKKPGFVCQIKLKCAEGWTYYPDDNLCIKPFDTPLSYLDAREHCQEEVEDGDLVEIKNEAASNFILDLNVSLKNWIGVQDANEDRVFHHLDGSGIEEYHPWNAGEPNNKGGKENCGMMYGQGGWAGKWNDDNCNNKYPFICSEKSK